MSARGTEAPSTQGEKHWTHRMPHRVHKRLGRGMVALMRNWAAQGVRLTAIAAAAGITAGYAHDVINGRRRKLG